MIQLISGQILVCIKLLTSFSNHTLIDVAAEVIPTIPPETNPSTVRMLDICINKPTLKSQR